MTRNLSNRIYGAWGACSIFPLFAGVLMGVIVLAYSHAQPHAPDSFQSLAQRAAAARAKGDLPSAIQLYRKALALKPDWQEGLWSYGSVLYDSNRFGAATAALHKLTVLNPKLGGAWAFLGLSEYETAQYGLALSDLQRARFLGTGSDADLADVVDYHVAVLLNAQSEPEAAQYLLSALFLRGRKSEDLQVAMGLALLRVPLLPTQIDPSKDALVHDAGTLAAVLAEKHYEDAVAGFRGLLEKYPGTSFVHYAWGAMLASQGRDDAAETQFEEETKLNPDSALAYTEWAYLESKATRYAQAVSLSQKAVQLAPNSFMAHYVLGSSLLATGKAEEAIPQLERARDLAPESPEIHYSLSRAYVKAGRNTLAEQERAIFIQLKNKRQIHQGNGPQNAAPKGGAAEAPQPAAPTQP
jgi:tetratricopeptide (TPR) repeat protein